MEKRREYLIVDGYNIINAWSDLNSLKEKSYAHARDKLIEILLNYQGLREFELVVVFDAHQVQGGKERRETFSNAVVVYTREGETADMFIERTVGELVGTARVVVATSDWVEQTMILQRGALRLSARELAQEIRATLTKNEEYLRQDLKGIVPIGQQLNQGVKGVLEKWRRGKT